MRAAIEWSIETQPVLSARTPTDHELRDAAPALAAAYSDPDNAPMMGHPEGDAFAAEDVIDHYAELDEDGGVGFLLYEGDVLVGDADLRAVDRDAGHAEIAIMLLPRFAQGRGLGTRFALMVHAFAFRTLGLRRVYAAILPSNHASQRMFERIGHRRDDSAVARALVDDDTELTFGIDRETFERMHEGTLGAIRITPMPRPRR